MKPPQQNRRSSFGDMHLGLFAHYTFVGKPNKWGSTEWADGKLVQSLDELADNLNVQEFADTAEAMRAQYVMFTAWHANMNALFPSKTMQSRLPGHCSRRDAIGDLIHALKAKHIRTVLYIHPSDGHIPTFNTTRISKSWVVVKLKEVPFELCNREKEAVTSLVNLNPVRTPDNQKAPHTKRKR